MGVQRDIAQPGSAPGLGPGERRFESFYPDRCQPGLSSTPRLARLTSWRSSSTVRAPPCQGGRWQFESALRRQGSIVHGIRSRTFNPWNWVRVPVELPRSEGSLNGHPSPLTRRLTSLLPFGIGVTAARKVLVLVVGVRIPRPELLPDSTMAVQRPVKAMVEGSSPSLAALVEVIK